MKKPSANRSVEKDHRTRGQLQFAGVIAHLDRQLELARLAGGRLGGNPGMAAQAFVQAGVGLDRQVAQRGFAPGLGAQLLPDTVLATAGLVEGQELVQGLDDDGADRTARLLTRTDDGGDALQRRRLRLQVASAEARAATARQLGGAWREDGGALRMLNGSRTAAAEHDPVNAATGPAGPPADHGSHCITGETT